MITVKNILNEYPKLDQAVLPKQLKQDEFDFVSENIDLYGQDETIDQFIDTFILQINKFALIEKKTSKKDKTKSRSNTIRKATKTKVRPTEAKETEPDKVAKKSAKKKRLKSVRKVTKAKAKPVKKTKTGKKVKSKIRKIAVRKVVKKPVKHPKIKVMKEKKSILNGVPSWLLVVRKFTRMANKEYTQRTLRAFLKDIQTKFAAKLNHSATPHIDLIRKIQLTIVTSVNEQLKKDKVKLKVNSTLIEDCRKLSQNYKIRQEKETGIVEVKPLSGIKKKNKQSGLSGFGIVSSQDLAKMDFKNLSFTGKFKELIGNPTLPFQIMIYGLPGSGKSSLAILFAKYLAENHNLKILYLVREEGISGTSKEKFTRLNAIHANIHLAEKMPDNLNDYDVLMIDSVNEMNMTPDHIRQIISKYPNLSTVQLFKATKEGKFLGQSDFAHLCQAEIRCLDGKAQAQKNRFGGNLEVKILD